MKLFKSSQTSVLAAACLISVALRLIESPLPNFSSVIAVSLLCGAVLQHPAGVLLPLAVRATTDLTLYLKGVAFFDSWMFDYAAYVLICLLGHAINPRQTLPVLGTCLISVALYFGLSNFGVWLMQSDFYEKSAQGLLLCYTNAVPFVRGTLIGNLVMSALFFGALNLTTSSEYAGDTVTAK